MFKARDMPATANEDNPGNFLGGATAISGYNHVLVTPASVSPVCFDHDEGILNRGVFVNPIRRLAYAGVYPLRLRCLHDSVSRLLPELSARHSPLVCHFQEHESREGGQGVDDRLVAILSSGLHPAYHTTEAPPLPGWRLSIARATPETKNKLFCGLEACQ
jgi:hypothetical protein